MTRPGLSTSRSGPDPTRPGIASNRIKSQQITLNRIESNQIRSNDIIREFFTTRAVLQKYENIGNLFTKQLKLILIKNCEKEKQNQRRTQKNVNIMVSKEAENKEHVAIILMNVQIKII